MIKEEPGFYVTGGTLPLRAPSYVSREADDRLLKALEGGELCYVLTSRQMGKSSLMVHTAERLRATGRAVVTLSLTSFGQHVSVEQWYDGLLNKLGEQLDIEGELEDWWEANKHLGPLQRWLDVVTKVALSAFVHGLVIFLDEIDVVKSLSFSTDEFFTGIRELYNRRSEDPTLNMLTFCLLGVASPTDLIRESRLTPFNVGTRIELTDFTRAEAGPLTRGLGLPEAVAQGVLERVLFWTGGQPYLTQRLCDETARSGGDSPEAVDRICRKIFLSPQSRDQDHNLSFVCNRLSNYLHDKAALLNLYKRILRRAGKVADDIGNPLITELHLAGIVRGQKGALYVRNPIYGHVFDRKWIAETMPDAELRRQRAAYRRGVARTALIAAALFIFAAGTAYFFWTSFY